MASPFTRFPDDSYWFVGSDVTQVYSTTDGDYVAVDDQRYLDWLMRGNAPGVRNTEQELWDYLNGRVLDGTPVGAYSSDEAKDARIAAQFMNENTEILFEVAFAQENRIRALEVLAARDRTEFLDYIKTLMK